MKLDPRDRAALLWIFGVALAIRIVLAFATAAEPLRGDAGLYDELARSIAAGKGYVVSSGKPTSFYMPLYPLLLGSVYALFGEDHLYAKLAQAFLGAATCGVIFLIGRKLFDRTAGLLAAGMAIVHYYFLVMGTLLLTETLLALLLSVFTLIWIRWREEKNPWRAGILGLICALATLTKSTYALLPFLVLAIECSVSWSQEAAGARRMRWAQGMLLLGCFMLPLSVWTVRNYLVHQAFVPLATQGGMVLYMSYNPSQGKVLGIHPEDEVTRRARERSASEVEWDRALLRAAAQSLREEPSRIYRYLPLKALNFWSVLDWEILRGGVYNFATAFTLPLALLGIVIAGSRPGELLPLLAPIMYLFGAALVTYGLPRFRFPVEPHIVILAGAGMLVCWRRLKWTGAIVVIVWLGINILLFFASSQLKELARSVMQVLGLW